MPDFNRVLLIGNLTRQPDCRYTDAGRAVGGFGLALHHFYHTPDGEEHEENCFVEVEIVGELAEKVREEIDKGDLVYVEGRLRLARWRQKRTGKERRRLKVTAYEIQAL